MLKQQPDTSFNLASTNKNAPAELDLAKGGVAAEEVLGISKGQFRIFEGTLALQEKKMGEIQQSFDCVNYTLEWDTLLDQA